MSVHLTAEARSRAIERITEARFMLSAFEELRRDPVHWASARSAKARGLYAQAVREKERLEAASDAELCDELLAIAR